MPDKSPLQERLEDHLATVEEDWAAAEYEHPVIVARTQCVTTSVLLAAIEENTRHLMRLWLEMAEARKGKKAKSKGKYGG